MTKFLTIIGTILMMNFSINAQTFSLIKSENFEHIGKIVDSTENCVYKAIFVQDDVKLLFDKGMPVSEKKIKTGNVANVVGFSNQKYQSPISEQELPYIKIRYKGSSYWTHGVYPFIFDDAHPDLVFKSQEVFYNVYTAKNIRFFNEGFEGAYIGYEIIIIKNISTNEYKLVICDKFPDALEGHSYGSKYVYLQNDDGVIEKFTGYSTEKHLVNLQIKAHYQEGEASYILTFPVPEEKPTGNYWGVRKQ